MHISEKPFFLIIIVLIIIGCGPTIPISDHSLQIKKSFHASFDKTWNAVLRIVKISKGTILTEDKSSGLIVYSIIDSKSRSQVYMQVYLKNHPTTNIIDVYLITQVRTGYYLGEIDRDFFVALEKTLEKK